MKVKRASKILMKKPINYDYSQVHRLCICVSGSLMTVICSSFAFIKVSCLHFGQYRGKFFSSVSPRICNLVLLPQTGHNIHSAVFIIFSPFASIISFSNRMPYDGFPLFRGNFSCVRHINFVMQPSIAYIIDISVLV